MADQIQLASLPRSNALNKELSRIPEEADEGAESSGIFEIEKHIESFTKLITKH